MNPERGRGPQYAVGRASDAAGGGCGNRPNAIRWASATVPAKLGDLPGRPRRAGPPIANARTIGAQRRVAADEPVVDPALAAATIAIGPSPLRHGTRRPAGGSPWRHGGRHRGHRDPLGRHRQDGRPQPCRGGAGGRRARVAVVRFRRAPISPGQKADGGKCLPLRLLTDSGGIFPLLRFGHRLVRTRTAVQ